MIERIKKQGSDPTFVKAMETFPKTSEDLTLNHTLPRDHER